MKGRSECRSSEFSRWHCYISVNASGLGACGATFKHTLILFEFPTSDIDVTRLGTGRWCSKREREADRGTRNKLAMKHHVHLHHMTGPISWNR